jgi:uncharacterized protein YceK
MKRFALWLTVMVSLSGCVSTASNTAAMAGITGHGRAVGTQGSTVARTNDVVAINTRDENERMVREVRGIPTPQPVRDPSMAAHSIPVPQPPIPTPPLGGGFAVRRP